MATASPAPKPRLPRPKQYKVDETALFSQWGVLANLKKTGFEWDGSDYTKASRALSQDESGLVTYHEPLVPLLKQAPSGFPTFHSVRQVLHMLHTKYNILGDIPEKQEFSYVSDAADKWRIMCKDVYEQKKRSRISSAGS